MKTQRAPLHELLSSQEAFEKHFPQLPEPMRHVLAREYINYLRIPGSPSKPAKSYYSNKLLALGAALVSAEMLVVAAFGLDLSGSEGRSTATFFCILSLLSLTLLFVQINLFRKAKREYLQQVEVYEADMDLYYRSIKLWEECELDMQDGMVYHVPSGKSTYPTEDFPAFLRSLALSEKGHEGG